MASISLQPNGRRVIQVVLPDGRRTSIRLGKVSKQHAESVKVHIEYLLASSKHNQPVPPQTKVWAMGVDERLRSALIRCYLIDDGMTKSLSEHIAEYLDRRTDLKPKSIAYLRNATDRLLMYFDAESPLRSINPAEAQDWRRWLLDEGLSEATVRTYARGAKQVFKDALEREYIDKNPFAKLPSGSIANTNDRFVTREEISTVMELCPNQVWRTFLALCRFGGLRAPSETHLIRWQDIDLDKRVMTVWSPKTEHHLGHESRETPIQSVLYDELSTLKSQLSEINSDEPVLAISRHNLHKRLAGFISQTSVEPWSDPFHCLRRSCQTEWAQEFPEYAVSRWMGNSMVVARRHYLKVPADLMTRASAQDTNPKAVQNAVQYPSEQPRIGPQQRER